LRREEHDLYVAAADEPFGQDVSRALWDSYNATASMGFFWVIGLSISLTRDRR
jgi:hypothetical protein